MKHLSQNRTDEPSSPRSEPRKPYKKPTLVVHGDVSRITGFLGQTRTGGGNPIGRLYRHS